MDDIIKYVSVVAAISTIVASWIAIFLFFSKRKEVSSVFKLLLNYSSQITLSELKAKLERINDLSAAEENDLAEIINIFSEIVGQIRGNKRLSTQCADIVSKMISITEGRGKLSEPRKRALVSELRETLRHIDLGNFEDLVGE